MTKVEGDILWLCVAAFLVFLMQAGFSFVETGFTRAKNAVNILMKNIVDFCLGTTVFWLIGFAIMFGPQLIRSFGFGQPATADAMLLGTDGKPSPSRYAFYLFQLVFCGTAATIVSGAMAERTKFVAYIVISLVICGLVYPVFGSLAWASLFDSKNAGFLEKLGFIDFAGSTVVHSIGGWVGLAGTILLGPRRGKYSADGKIAPIFGHNMSMATLGVFLLWFGWFGFNAGSTGTIKDGSFALIAVTTNMAAATGGIGAMVTSWLLFRRPDISMTLNGVLAGLVAITSPCANVSVNGAALIGLVAGVLVMYSVLFFDRIRVDDPVGAVSVHGVCGAWGTLAAGLFASPEFGGRAGLFYGGGFGPVLVQLTGIGIAFAWAFGVGLVVFFLLRLTIGLRVTSEEEVEGLDIFEHGNLAYPESN